jgi:hypothetical protein
MPATMTNTANAKRLAATIGVNQLWCLQLTNGRLYVVADAYGSYGSGRRWAVTDDDAIEMARKAGVICSDEGEVTE